MKKEMCIFVFYEWIDEVLDVCVKEGIEIVFCVDCIKKEFEEKVRNINIIFLILMF